MVSESMGKVSLSVKNDKEDTANVTLCDVLYTVITFPALKFFLGGIYALK